MAVDFGLLNIQTPRANPVVARLPDQSPTALGTLMSGLFQGAGATQKLQANQQAIDLNKQINPLKIQEAQNQVTLSNMDVQDKKDQAAQNLATSQAFQTSWQAGLDNLKQTNPAGYLNLMKSQAEIQNTMSSISDKMADTDKKKSDIYNSMALTGAKLAQAASAAEDPTKGGKPGQGDVVYQQGLKMLGPALAASLPAHYDETTHMALLGLGGDVLHQQATDAFNKSATPQMKAANRIGDLTNKVQDNSATAGDKAELAQLLQANAPKESSAKNPFDTALAGQAAKEVTQMDTQSQALNIVHDDAKDALEILKKIPAGYTGPVVDFLKINGMNTDVQKIQKLTSGIPIAVKAMYGVTPGNRLTTSELNQLNKASGSTAVNKEALQWVLNRLIPQTEGIMHDNWVKQDATYKNASPEIYKNWKDSHPEPARGFNQQTKEAALPQVPDGRMIVYDKTGNIAGHIPNTPDQIKEALAAGYLTAKPGA